MLNMECVVCSVHTVRKLLALFKLDKEIWAGDMRTILFDALKLTNLVRSRIQDAVDAEDIMAIERRYDACCEQAIAFHENQPPLVSPSGKKKRGRPKWRIGHNLALRLQRSKAAEFLFLHDLDVPFSNNEAERDLRMTKVRQKISGCFRTDRVSRISISCEPLLKQHENRAGIF